MLGDIDQAFNIIEGCSMMPTWEYVVIYIIYNTKSSRLVWFGGISIVKTIEASATESCTTAWGPNLGIWILNGFKF